MSSLLNDLQAVEALIAVFKGVNLSELEADASAAGADAQALGAAASKLAQDLAQLLNDLKAQLPSASPKP